MIEKNSGKLYLFELDFKMGFGCCLFKDYTDVSTLTGSIISVFNHVISCKDDISLTHIANSKILFGPLPLFKQPNSRGKGAWKMIGEVKDYDRSNPIFKMTSQKFALFNTKDWSTINSWEKKYEFNIGDKIADYESLRHLELPVLCTRREIEIRTTMHFLIKDKKNVAEYYDLSDSDNKDIFIKMVNTSFAKKEVNTLLKMIG